MALIANGSSRKMRPTDTRTPIKAAGIGVRAVSPKPSGGEDLIGAVCQTLEGLGISPSFTLCGMTFNCEQLQQAVNAGELALSLDGSCSPRMVPHCTIDTLLGPVTICRKQTEGDFWAELLARYGLLFVGFLILLAVVAARR